jgi:hypothetical protein
MYFIINYTFVKFDVQSKVLFDFSLAIACFFRFNIYGVTNERKKNGRQYK